ncbi:MAG: hypothetical protein M1383_06380 [Patescibacteria group bacterium]|nr:hypothetical protein [Patescibacteria group bacterium]
MDYPTYQVTVFQSLKELYYQVLVYVPNLIAAIIVVILGWLVALFLSKLVLKILELVKIDHLADQLGLQNLSEKAGRRLSLAKTGAWIVKWFFFLSSFIAAADILGLRDVSVFLYQDVLGYAGHVVVAMAILLLGILAANFFSGIVETTVKAGGMGSSKTLGALTKWSIVAFAVITALSELLPTASGFLQDLFKAIVAMVAIAGGIAFGLGGRDHAKKILDKVEQEMGK